MAKNDNAVPEQGRQEQPQAVSEEPAAAPHPDAAYYVVQPTSAEIPAAMGKVPPGRFTEEVLKGSDEEKSSKSWDAHPEENQPAYGVTAESGQPDTSGRRRNS